ncbi:MAG: carbohydrate porin [Reyranella sp.]|nr:carbohydrate porin [Reyranella sp.]
MSGKLLVRVGVVAVWCAFFGATALQGRSAHAGEPAATNPGLSSWLRGQYMTGDWNGTRSDLEAKGVTLRAHHIAESAANPIGGLKQGAAYTEQVDAGADFDLEKLIGWPKAKLHVTFTQRAGQSLAANTIGSYISVQEIYGAGQNVRLAQLSYEQLLLEDRLQIKLGWLHASDDFATSPIYCYFQNNGFCGQIAIVVNSGFTIYPTGSWGGMAKVNLSDEVYVQTGVYEVNPTLAAPANGFKLGISGATGVIMPAQLGWQPRLGAAGLKGHYRLGGYYDTSDVPYLGSPPGGKQALARGRWGFYVQADQMIYRTAPGSDRGLTAFAVIAYGAPGTAMLEYIGQLGLLQRGTFADRDDDTIGLAVSYSKVSSTLAAAQNAANAVAPGSVGVQSAETTIELNYRAQLTPWFSLMPNVQYVIRPNGVTTIPNAFVLGLQVKLTF